MSYKLWTCALCEWQSTQSGMEEADVFQHLEQEHPDELRDMFLNSVAEGDA